MNIYRDLNQTLPVKNAVVTTGSFDGVHIGHKTILKRLNDIAEDIGGESTLITFHPHPRKVLYPETAGRELKLISSQREKIELLRKVGLHNLIIVPFNIEFSKMSSVDFIRNILVKKLYAHTVVIGFNHHFGHNREGDFEHLHELGKYYNFMVEEIPQQDIDNETVSSTKIREAIKEGRIQRANAYLDHHYIIIAELYKIKTVLDTVGLPVYRVIIDEDVKLIPPEGVYAISVSGNGIYLKGMLNISNPLKILKPNGQEMVVELHLFDCENDLTNETLMISFHKRMRDEMNFNDAEQLITQLNRDKEDINELIY
ncbi:MAG: riboflavin biosynthesis protein RibF [Bacteroidales bacterium]|jgi:riboflavin kinase/FMN adenylyltransferase|nr:riboflavin biosynthesis protein RibF [Bacteroidales bacterium]